MEKIQIREYNIQHINPSSTWIILGPPNSGKSCFITDLIYYNSYKYPVCRVNTSVPSTYKDYCSIFPPLTVHAKFNEKDEENLVEKRQKPLSMVDHPGTPCVYILDDIGRNASFNSSFFKDIFQKGRHYNLLTVVVNQNALEFPPSLRSAATYIVIFKFDKESDKRKLFENYASKKLFENYQKFSEIYNNLTEDHSCMIIKKPDKNMKEEETLKNCVFYYKGDGTKKKWKFGCRELINWSSARIDESKIQEFC